MVGNMCSGCILSAPATVLNAPGVSKASWGGIVRYDLEGGRTAGLGILQDNPTNWQNTNGWNWGHGHSDGTIAVANYTQRRSFDTAEHPYKFEAGLFHTSASYDDPLYNTDGSSQVQNPAGTPLRHRGRTGGYVQGRQVVWRGASGGFGAPENVAAYGGLVLTPGAAQTYPVEAYAGSEWSGFVPSNPLAMVGAGVRYIQLSERRAQYEQQVRAGYTTAINMATGGAVPVVNEAVARNMFLFDVHGRIGLVPGVFVESTVQYLKNPNAMIPATTNRIRSGYMFGVSLIVDFGVLSGLARMPGDKIF
jgi:porin